MANNEDERTALNTSINFNANRGVGWGTLGHEEKDEREDEESGLHHHTSHGEVSSSITRRSRRSTMNRSLRERSSGSRHSCMYDFEHDCSLAHCEDPVADWLDKDRETSHVKFMLRMCALYGIGLVAVYSSVGSWLSIWNNMSLTGFGLIGCQHIKESGLVYSCLTPSILLPFCLIIFGVSLTYIAGSLLQNGQIVAPNDPLFSRVEQYWEERVTSNVLFFLRGAIAYLGQVSCTCGMYTLILMTVSQDHPHPLKDVGIALFGLTGFTSIIIFYEYYKVGLSIEVMEGEAEPEEQVILGVNVPEPQHVVHLSTLLDIGPPVVLEPWEEPTTREEVREELDELMASNTPLATMRSRLRHIMSHLQTRQRLANLRYAVLSLFSLFLQSCSWLGMDRICQIWLFPGKARKEMGIKKADAAAFQSELAEINDWLVLNTVRIKFPDYPTAYNEMLFMIVGLSLMFISQTFLIHSCVEPTRNIASEVTLATPFGDMDRTKGAGLVVSWFIEFIGLVGNFMNLTGFWYLIDEHIGLPQNTFRNCCLVVFFLPLVLSGVFFNDAGINADEQGAIKYLGLGLRRVSTAIAAVLQATVPEDNESDYEQNPLLGHDHDNHLTLSPICEQESYGATENGSTTIASIPEDSVAIY